MATAKQHKWNWHAPKPRDLKKESRKDPQTFEELKAFLLEEKRKIDAEKNFQESVARLDANKAEVKKANKKSKLTKSVMAAKHQSPQGLDLHSEENRYYSEENTKKWLEGTSYFENYQAMREQDDY